MNDAIYETRSLSISRIPCASRRLQIEECCMTATWSLPCKVSHGRNFFSREKTFFSTSHCHHIRSIVGLIPLESPEPGRDQKWHSWRPGDGDWACPHRRFCSVLRVRNEQYQKSDVSLPNRSEAMPCKRLWKMSLAVHSNPSLQLSERVSACLDTKVTQL